MKKKQPRKLTLTREAVRTLTTAEVELMQAGARVNEACSRAASGCTEQQ